jgi:pyrimidine deaminase RibD-like protein
MNDQQLLRQAIALARRCPPSRAAFSVGALVADPGGAVIATGFSRQELPHDHAEEVALRGLDRVPASASLYSSLEPCGQRASRPVCCAQLIIAAGIRRVVFAWREPSTFVTARGASLLREAGIDIVELPELASEAAAVNAHLRN